MHRRYVVAEKQHFMKGPGVALIAAVVLGGLIAALQPTTDLLLTSLIFGLLVIPLLVRASLGRFDPFEPLTVFALAYGTMFVIRPLRHVIENSYLLKIGGLTQSFEETFTETLILGSVGAAAFMVGYHVRLGTRLAGRVSPPPTSFSSKRTLHVALGAMALTVLLFLVFLVQAGGVSALKIILAGRSEALTSVLDTSSSYLFLAPYMLVPATLLLVITGIKEHHPGRVALGVLAVAIAILIRGPSGSRSLLLPLFASPWIAFYLLREARPRGRTLVSIGLVALLASALIFQTRDTIERQRTGGVAAAASRLLHNPVQAAAPILSGGDAAEEPALAVALTVVPEQSGYSYGRATLGDFLIRPIPKGLWPGKPLSPREQLVAGLWGRGYYQGGVNPEFSALLSPYLDFGLIGVAVAMTLYGLTARTLYELYRLHHRNLAALALFAVTAPLFVQALRDQPVDAVTRAVLVVLPLLVAFRWWPWPKTRHASGRRLLFAGSTSSPSAVLPRSPRLDLAAGSEEVVERTKPMSPAS